MKKILLFSRDPGGANTVIPLFEVLMEKNYKVILYGKDTALKKYSDNGFTGIDIMTEINDIDYITIRNLLNDLNPDFVITGTSADDFTEKYIWKAAEELEIPSFAILDQWVNYGLRFSDYKVSELNTYNKNRIIKYLPTKICVMDEIAYNEMIEEGFNPERILITGQPYFETVKKKKESITMDVVQNIRDKAGISSNDFLITFASEPISDTYKETDFSEHYWGYTERTIIKELLTTIIEISEKIIRNIALVIKQHPKEKPDNYNDIISSVKSSKIKIYIDRESNPNELIAASDLVCGMSSMFLIESVIMNKPILSIQIGLTKENPLVLARLNYLKSVLSKIDLLKKMEDAILKRKMPECSFTMIQNSVENIISNMENIICQN